MNVRGPANLHRELENTSQGPDKQATRRHRGLPTLYSALQIEQEGTQMLGHALLQSLHRSDCQVLHFHDQIES